MDGPMQEQPLEDEALEAEMCRKLVQTMGLHDSPDTKENCVAGIYHPAFRELCESRVMLRSALEQLSEHPAGTYTLTVAQGATSKMVGQRRCNLMALEQAGYKVVIKESNTVDYLKVLME